MKKLIYHTFFILTGCMFAGTLVGQTDVKLLDLTIVSQFGQLEATSDSVELLVHFKINKANEALKTHFWLGTSKDSSNVLIAEPVFSTVNNVTNVVYDGISNKVINYTASFRLKLSGTTYSSFLAATLFVETVTGQMTSRLYFTK